MADRPTQPQLRRVLLREQRAAFLNAVENAQNQHSVLVDFSIYSLPVAQQSTFKLLLLMPLGALVVVILRNLVGLRTSGTFMPMKPSSPIFLTTSAGKRSLSSISGYSTT